MDESRDDTDVDVFVHPEGAVHILPTGIRWISYLQKVMMWKGNLQRPVADFYHDKVGVSWSSLYSLFNERLSWKCGRYQLIDQGGMEFNSRYTFDTIWAPADPILLCSSKQDIDPVAIGNRLDEAQKGFVAVDVMTLDHLEWSEDT